MHPITPIRKVKEGAKGSYYEGKVSCGNIKIFIADDEDGYPVRLTAQYSGGGCGANLEVIQRLITLLLECNVRVDIIIGQLNKVFCPACRTKFAKGDKEIALSCSRAIARALEKHLNNGGEQNGKKDYQKEKVGEKEG